ncbi:MAG TPA: hypothetical protein VE959_32135 [Bryobacteraceae bacterium]|nr:hypothetical protein [Bryobacteraceae bacterium]
MVAKLDPRPQSAAEPVVQTASEVEQVEMSRAEHERVSSGYEAIGFQMPAMRDMVV